MKVKERSATVHPQGAPQQADIRQILSKLSPDQQEQLLARLAAQQGGDHQQESRPSLRSVAVSGWIRGCEVPLGSKDQTGFGGVSAIEAPLGAAAAVTKELVYRFPLFGPVIVRVHDRLFSAGENMAGMDCPPGLAELGDRRKARAQARNQQAGR